MIQETRMTVGKTVLSLCWIMGHTVGQMCNQGLTLTSSMPCTRCQNRRVFQTGHLNVNNEYLSA